MGRIGFIGIIPLLACTGETVIDKQTNSAPTILIVSHSPDAELQEGYSEAFRATVSDDDNEFSELQTAWYVGDQLVCDWAEASPAGDSTCEIIFGPDDLNVIAEVRDDQGAGGRAEIAISVNPTQAPQIELVSPLQGDIFYSNQLIQFAAIISDQEDSPEELIVSWTSSLDGELILDVTPDAMGQISDFTYLSEGQHAIELRVEDTSGKVTKEQLVLQVGGENSIPTCEITSPVDLSAVVIGDSILFRGQIGDENIPANDLSSLWISDKDGELGVGTVNSSGEATFTYSGLSANDHVISLIVEDEVGAQCEDTIVLYVGTPPTATIDQPLDGEVYSIGDSIVFQGTLSDQEDQPNELSVVWSSSLDGELMSGTVNSQGISQFSSASLTPGVHSVTLTATDTTGLVADDLISFRVNTPPEAPILTLSPDPISSTQTLQAMVTSSFDADGDNVSYTYEWYENAILTSVTGASVPDSELDVGEIWTVRVTPNDGYIDGPYAESSITVANTEPTLSSVTISSSDGGSVYNDSTLTCAATASDPDETLTPSYSWDIGGVIVTGSSVNLSNYSLLPGDSLTCTASVADSNGGSASSDSSETVDNRAPTVSAVSISPSTASSTSLLTCSATDVDPDGETLLTSFEWFIAGSSVGTGDQLQLDGSLVTTGTVVECIVTAEDPSGASAQDSGSVTIQNSAPIFSQAAEITPNTGVQNGTNLECSAVATDPDDGVASLSYIWLVQGVQVSTGPNWTVDQSDAAIGDSITCTAIALDFQGNTSTSNSSPVIVENTPPEISSVSLSSLTPDTEEIITASIISSDGDNHSLSFYYEWHVLDASNGGQDILISAGSGTTYSSLSGLTDFDRDDEVFVFVTPNDGLIDGAAVESNHAIVQNTEPTEPIISLTSSAAPDDPAAGEDDLICTIDTISTDLDLDAVYYTYEWYDGLDPAPQQTTSSTQALQDTLLASGVTLGTWTCEVTADDGTDLSITAAATIDVVARESCLDYRNSGFVTDGVYQIMRADGVMYDAYCDMNTENGGWTRIVGTDTYNHDWGQTTSSIVSSYATASDSVGVAEAFEKLQSFSQVMIKKTSGTYTGEFAAYDLVETISGQSVLDILQYCSSQPNAYGSDSAWDGARVVGYTSHYSGTQYAGNLLMGTNNGDQAPDYFFMCGVNESSDNDQSALAFCDNPGNSNWWSDYWRGNHQRGAMWSFWNGDYHYSGAYHIGNGYAQGYAGYKNYSATNTGSYEVYVR